MQKDAKNYGRQPRKHSKLIKCLILLLCVSGFIVTSCTQYNPAFYPGYDVLNPSAEVRENPIRTTSDGLFAVNSAFLQWVDDLQAEIEKLRKK